MAISEKTFFYMIFSSTGNGLEVVRLTWLSLLHEELDPFLRHVTDRAVESVTRAGRSSWRTHQFTEHATQLRLVEPHGSLLFGVRTRARAS